MNRLHRKSQLIILCLLLILVSCAKKVANSLKPEGYEKQNVLTIKNGDLKAVFVDNTAIAPHHKAGYNGIAELYHVLEETTLFVPDYAGFNLEFIFGGDSLHQLF